MPVNTITYWMGIVFAFLFSISSHAFELDSSKFRINGFGSLGLTKADNELIASRNNVNQKGIFDEWSSRLDSNLGLQLNYDPTDKLHFALQLVAEERSNNSLNRSVHWAYLGYDVTPSLELRLGRTGPNAFLLSDYRKVGYAQLWTHAPLEFYGQFSSDYGDGISLIHKTPLAGGVLRTQTWFNQSKLIYNSNGEEIPLELKPTYGITATWENDAWTYNASFVNVRFLDKKEDYKAFQQLLTASLPIWPQINPLIDEVTLDNTQAHYYGFGVAYNKNDWTIQTELSLTETESSIINRTRSAYVLIGHRFGTLTPYMVAAIAKNDDVDVPAYNVNPFLPDATNAAALALQQGTQQFADSFHKDQKTLSLGIRWDIEPKVALKAQWERTWVDPHGGTLLMQPEPLDNTETIDRFTLKVDFLY
ncbi:MAG: hypothetical protein P1P93_04230 [Gammaproteobacteria bacterium]|nr:hypothetical protein [Gammaproteobacteria bacterium]